MKKTGWLFGLIALTAALSLGSADLAAAQNYGGGRGQGAGRKFWQQSGQSQTGAPMYRQGQGQGQGQRQRLHRRDGSCLNTAVPTAPAPAAPATGN